MYVFRLFPDCTFSAVHIQRQSQWIRRWEVASDDHLFLYGVDTMTRTLDSSKSLSLVKLAWPLFLDLLLQLLVGNVDQMMISRYSQVSVAAIGNANQIINILIIALSVVSTASTILISVQLGAGNEEKVSAICMVALVVNAIICVASTLVVFLASRQVFQFLKVPADVLEEALAYTYIVGAGLLFQGVYLAFVSFFRAYSLVKEALLVSLLMNVANIVGNALLIYGVGPLPRLGIVGVAISTTFSKLVAMFVLFFLFRKRIGVPLRFSTLKPFPWDILKRVMHLGLPSGGEEVSYNASQLCIMAFVNMLGTWVITTKVYCTMIAMMCYIFSRAMAQAQQIIIGHLVGAGKSDEIDRRVKRTTFWSVVISVGVTIVLYLFSDQVFGLFTSDPQILALGKRILFLEVILEVGRAVNIVMVLSLQAVGDVNYPVGIGIVCMWLVAVLFSWVFGIRLGWGLPGIWIAMAMDECIRAALFIVRWQRGKWKSMMLYLERKVVSRPSVSLEDGSPRFGG